LKSVAAADGVSLGHIDLMVAQLNEGIFGKMGNCSMIEKVYVPNVVLKTPSPSYGVSVVQFSMLLVWWQKSLVYQEKR
jgi:hypothetical protein